jgi:hypothetical protein
MRPIDGRPLCSKRTIVVSMHRGARRLGRELKALGGTVVGAVRHPTGTADFSSFILSPIFVGLNATRGL